MNWIDAGKNESTGKRIMLASLTPKFDEESHRAYYDLLSRAIDAPGVRNVALTGAYGTGKSSILEQIVRDHSDDVVEISLSTIAPPRRKTDDESPKDEKAETNLIQKEIVKQLLYRLPAHKTPSSRFRRTSAPQTRRDWTVAAIIGAFLVTGALLLGLLQPLVESVVPEPWGRRVLAYGVVMGLTICGAWLLRKLFAGGPAMSASVGAGLTSVTLSSATNTYFDEYLDEIVYFFQISKIKVVVIEDIDRFEDIKVFDALRALNVLLNSSSGIERIVFVYAIRDSIFERIEGVTSPEEEDATRKANDIANRAKFFDVIIPVVPFVNADNARDVMSRAMESDKFLIDQSLIRISARHLADMRLIHNMRNEFEVYRSRLVIPPSRVYGITDDLVFAMIVFKNAHPGDFEKIRHKDSTLDHLYKSWRELVNSNLDIQLNRLARLRATSELEDTADERARLWGQRLIEHVKTLRTGLQPAHGRNAELNLVGAIDESKLQQRETWRAIASGERLQLHATAPTGHNLHFTFSAKQIGAMLGITIDSAEWDEPIPGEIEAQISDCEEKIRFLRHHTWAELRNRPEFTIKEAQRSLTFEQLIHEKLPSPLAEELVRRGFITSHFALYTSTYYGTHLGPDAIEYVRRCVEPGEPDTLFHLDEDSVKQLLIEQGAESNDDAAILEDPSILNVSIVDYLLQSRPHSVAKIAKGLTERGEQESEFVDNYCARGVKPELLLAEMVSGWPKALQYTSVGAPLPPEKRVAAVDAIILALPSWEQYSADEKVRSFLEAHYADLASVTSPASPEKASIALGTFSTCGAIIRDVNPLNADAREQVIARRLYSITDDNLLALARASSISLDSLLQADKRVFDHVMDHLDEYLVVFADSAHTEHTIQSNDTFVEIVTKACENGNPENINRLVSQSSQNVTVRELSEVPPSAWPIILAESRTHSSFSNIRSYLSGYSSVDDAMANFLTKNDVIEVDEDTDSLEERREVSLSILNAGDMLPAVEVRVGLAVQLDPGRLSAETIRPEHGEFARRLIEENLIADDSETFASQLMVDWRTREGAIQASTNFGTFVSPVNLPAAEIPELLQSKKVAQDIKKTVVNSLPDYVVHATRQEVEEIARSLNTHEWKIGTARVRALVSHGASASEVVQLIVRNPDIPFNELRQLLREMGEPYARLADVGRRPVFLPADKIHQALSKRLEGITVSTFTEVGQQLKVNMLRTER